MCYNNNIIIIDPQNYTIQLSEDDLEELDARGELDGARDFGIDLIIYKEELAASIDDLVLGEAILYEDWMLTAPATV